MTGVRPAGTRTRSQGDAQPVGRPIVAEPGPHDAVAQPRGLARSSTVKRVAVLLAVLAALGLLSACSPAVTAVSAIGYDSQGRLVGAVKVCDGDFPEAHLAPTTPEGTPDIGAWRRRSSFTGTESWPLRPTGAGPWKAVGPALRELASGNEFVFWVQPENETSRSDFLVFPAATSPSSRLARCWSGATDRRTRAERPRPALRSSP
jgi:hypothetical protein